MLHLAAIIGNQEIVDQLLTHGADISIRCGGELQTTPLHYAVVRSHLSIVRTLVARGADLAARDSYGHTPAQCAVAVGQEGIIQLVLEGNQRPVVRDLYRVLSRLSGVRSSLDLMHSQVWCGEGFDCVILV